MTQEEINLPVLYEELDYATKRLVRAEYEKRQGGLCMYCQTPLTEEPPQAVRHKPINWKRFPPNFLRYPIHLQHNHTSGLTEGVVHAYCNAVLWQYHGR